MGLSGGVDSAVSAALLQKDGHEVVGCFIRITVPGYPCTAGQDRIDAMRVAAHLKIPFREVDLSAEYKQKVFDLSVAEFAQGRTPNPDMLCNREIKFGLFFAWCMEQGADMVATGHYAQVAEGKLYAGADPNKDQSYFLALVPQAALHKTLFPIGHLHKPQVRTLAKKFGLPNANRPDSQGLCFLGPVSVADMLRKEIAPAPGAVLNQAGQVVGTHDGAALYTMGQRHGFSLAAHSPHTKPHFVIAKDLGANTIMVAESKFPHHASGTTVKLAHTNWLGEWASATHARYRYRQTLIAATMQSPDFCTLQEPHYVPEGQTLVLYAGTRCLGGGVIKKSTVY